MTTQSPVRAGSGKAWWWFDKKRVALTLFSGIDRSSLACEATRGEKDLRRRDAGDWFDQL